MENKHTPTPWVIDETDKSEPCIITKKHRVGNIICISPASFEYSMKKWKANAEFIVTACNNYQALKEENEELKAAIKEAAIWIEEEADALMETPQRGAAAIMYMRLAPLTEILTKHSK